MRKDMPPGTIFECRHVQTGESRALVVLDHQVEVNFWTGKLSTLGYWVPLDDFHVVAPRRPR